MNLQQILTIIVLFIFNFQLLDNIPIKIGPLTSTMIFEIAVFILILPSLRSYAHNLGRRGKYILLVCFCMLVLSYINLSSKMLNIMPGLIFSSMYAYFMIVCFFSGGPEYGIWLRRLHLIPAYGIICHFAINIPDLYSGFDLTTRVAGNQGVSTLMLILPICWTQFRREQMLFRFLNLFAIGSAFVMLIVTASRTAFLCLLTVSILIIIMEKPGAKIKVLMVSLLVALAVYIILPAESEFKIRITSLLNPISAFEVDRLSLWKAAILSITENPLLGGDFRSNVFRLVSEVAPESNYARHIFFNVAGGNFGTHNGYLATAVDFGIIVAFLYFCFHFFLGRDMLITRRKIRDEANQRFLTTGIISLGAYAILNLTLHAYIGLDFFIIWAVLQCSVNNALLEEELEASQS